MIIEEARLFFPLSPTDDPDELYAERLFDYKQFFLTKNPIRKVFEARIHKMLNMDRAYRLMCNLPEEEQEKRGDFSPVIFSDRILESFQVWEAEKSRIKKAIMQSNRAIELADIVRNYLYIAQQYRKKWFYAKDIDMPIESISQEVDPMEMLFEIQQFEQQGGRFFGDIYREKTNVFLLKEMKRVSLFLKKYGDDFWDV